MLHEKLIMPKSIVVVGGSDNLHNLGGSVLRNLIEQQYQGELFVVNPKKDRVQNKRSYRDVREIPQVDLAIIAIPAEDVVEVAAVLAREKNTRGFIVYSAGFSELNEEGAAMERQLRKIVDEVGGSLLGPNNIGLVNQYYAGVFTRPLPKMDPAGVDFVSGSGATAVFTLEAAHQIGLTFSALYTVGNSAQTGVEEILEHLDETYVQGKSSRVKLLYIEGIRNPEKFLRHCVALRNKGCSIAALKSGVTEKGNIAAASHTGAMASPDIFVQALFDKAGIVRCQSRYELITVASILQQSKKLGKRIAIITHAGGPGVILTDVLTRNGVDVPTFSRKQQLVLQEGLYPGASAKNPVDMLATGTAEQLSFLLEYCDKSMEEVDAMVVIFGSPGLGSVAEAYDVIGKKIDSCRKAVFAILPSVVNVHKEIRDFIGQGHIAFYDESLFGASLAKVMRARLPVRYKPAPGLRQLSRIKSAVSQCANGYLDSARAFEILSWIGIPVAYPMLFRTEKELLQKADALEYPVAQKVDGILHKSDQKGVILHVHDREELLLNFRTLMSIPGAKGVLVQKMAEGTEVFVGAKKQAGFPPLLLCGMGGIYVEVLKDLSHGMCPVSEAEANAMIRKLHAFKVLKGTRGQPGIDLKAFARVVQKVSRLVEAVPEIAVLEINPLLATSRGILAVDARIRIQK